VDEFSISLDFPDERHDENRGAPGLYQHLSELIPNLTRHGKNDITLVSVIREQNLNDLPALAEHTIKWNTKINFSAYTTMRTGDVSLSVQPEHLALLRKQIDYLIEFKRKTGRIFTSESILNRYYEFFANGSNIPNCKAGYRCLVVNPDGKMTPCALQYTLSYNTQKELIENFSKNNTCSKCYVSMRANTEKSFTTLIKDSWALFRQIRRNNKLPVAC
jgi:MoaA/NifB/PqqE/SkfB family radical SAM enzyme